MRQDIIIALKAIVMEISLEFGSKPKEVFQEYLDDNDIYFSGVYESLLKFFIDLNKTDFSECVVQGSAGFGLKIKPYTLVIPNEIVEDYL